ncbi:MAG TPA: glycosyltransferase family 2 protein [Candidatus Moranbacteria bacterium]|nr:glycosyltransferase family 2 protein [Candidatus Moranbacteria bacterium]
MQLSIIITNYKNPELLKVCIDSIRKNLTLTDYEIIVADGSTEEDTRLMMKENFPEIIFLPFNDNVGFANLVRAGYKKSSGQYVLVMNGDMIIKKDSIESLMEYVKNNPDVGLVGPRLLNFNGSFQSSCFRFYTPLTIIYRRTPMGKMKFAQKHLDRFLMKDFDLKSIKEVDWLMGSALMGSRMAMEKVGPIDNRYKMYFEDVDWCRRFWEKGYKVIYYPKAEMYHYHGKGSAGKSLIKTLLFNKLAWWHISSAVKYFIKYAGKQLPQHK